MRKIPIEDAFDLHSFRPEDVSSALAEYLREVRLAGLREVRIIHGKGTGVRRAQVRKILASQDEVEEFDDAPPERGGFGATVVRVRVKEKD